MSEASLSDIRYHSLHDSICVGDLVCLYSDDVSGFLFANQTSSVFCGLTVQKKQDRENPKLPDSQAFAFEIVTANRYKLNLKYIDKVEEAKKDPENEDLQYAAKQAGIAAQAENDDNLQEQQRLTGKQLQYGQIIQLRHVFSKKYIQVSTSRTSLTESNNMLVKLSDYNAKHCQLKVMPRFKVKAEGDLVHIGDQIIFESIKTPGQYLHVNNARYPPFSQYSDKCSECKLSVRPSGFSIYRQRAPHAMKENQLKAGSFVRFFHKELEAYLVAEGLFSEEVAEDVHLRVRPVDPNKPSTLLPSSAAITYWQVEKQEGALSGGVVGWQQQVRLRHMTTRKYLKVNGDVLELTDSHKDPLTVFRLHRVMQKGDTITYGSYCRIEHAVSKCWLGASQEDYVRKQADGDGSSFGSLKYTFAPLKKVVKAEEMKYDDAFTIQAVDKEHVEVFNFVAGMVPFIQNMLADLQNGLVVTAKYAHQVITALKEISSFLVVDGEPVKIRQKLLRHLKIIELLVKLLHTPVDGPGSTHLVAIFAEIFELISVYRMGESRKNELYIAKYIPFFLELITNPQKDLALHAVRMVTAVLRGNRRIVDRFQPEQIDQIVELLKQQKNHRYLDLLSVLCVCDSVAMVENQTYITKAWLVENKQDTIYLTELGDRIPNGEKGVVYITNDKGVTWTPLSTFAKKAKQAGQKQDDDEYIFLEKQLDLLASLAYGRNEYAIDVITEQLDLLSWDEAFACLQDESIPDKLRAQYCNLIICLFVDLPGNSSWLDRINLSYAWDSIGTKQKGKSHKGKECSPVTKEHFPALRTLIEEFLSKSEYMVASKVGRNLLIWKVLRLVYLLVEYGFYDTDDIRTLMKSLMNVLDGRKDKQYPQGKMNAEKWKAAQETFTQKGRFLPSAETKAITDAKYQALRIVDLCFNILMTTRLEDFINDFKETATQARLSTASNSELTPLLYKQFKLKGNESCASQCVARLKAAFSQTSLFDDELITIILDLSNYQYKKMVRQSMTLINRFYSAYDSLFRMAIRAQVFKTEESCKVMKAVQKRLPVLKRLKNAKLNKEQLATLSEILDMFIGFCTLPGESEDRHPMNQIILYNHDILDDIFDILSEETDAKLKEQFETTRQVFQKCFQLLQGLARGNYEVQKRLFDRLDLLLKIEGAPNDLADVLIEIFRDNRKICFNILPHHIQTIMGLVAQHKSAAPQLLEALRTLVKVKRMPLKRNQVYVMKYFMQYRSEIALVFDQPADDIILLLGSVADDPELCYLMGLVDLLAACTEGENAFIESICQTIFSLDVLLKILCSETIDNNRKRPYLRFFVGCYLYTAKGIVESGAADLASDERLLKLIELIIEEFKVTSTFAVENSQQVRQFLKKRPKKTLQTDGGEARVHGTLHFLLDASFYFLEAWIQGFFSIDPDFDQKKSTVNDLARAVLSFAEHVGPHIRDDRQQRTMAAGINAILSASSVSAELAEKFIAEYGVGKPRKRGKSDAVKAYEAYYAEEEELKNQFDVFAYNYRTAYHGKNTVKDQIGFPSEQPYTQPGSDEELPLGEEFQQLVACFVNRKGNTEAEKYAPAKVLIDQLKISASSSLLDLPENVRIEQELLDVKCLQVLRAMIHNEIVKLSDNWEEDYSVASQRQIAILREVQQALGYRDAMLKVLPQLSRPSDNVVRETLAFLSVLLFGGNIQVQDSLHDYFLSTREESFFFTVKNAIEMSAVSAKEKRILRDQYGDQRSASDAQAKALQAAFDRTVSDTGNAPASASKQPKKNQVAAAGAKPDEKQASTDDHKLVEIKVDRPAAAVASVDDDDDIIDEKNDGHIELVLCVLGLVCDGQNKKLQEYMREQADNIKTYNLVATTARFLSLVYSDVNPNTADLLIELFSTLEEFAVGNLANQAVLYDAKVVHCINFILRSGKMAALPQQKQYELYLEMGKLTRAITEENSSQNMDMIKEMLETLDTQCVYSIFLTCHSILFPADGTVPDKALRFVVKRVGFTYYHLIRRMEDLLPGTVNARSKAVGDDEKKKEAMKFYDEHSMSVEVLRENELHRVYFYVADPSVLREEVKEKFSYAVDRTSPTDKLRDFLHWSREIMSDMKYQKRILGNPIARLLVNGWWWMNVSCILLSLAIAVAVIVGWKSPDSAVNTGPGFWPPNYSYIPVVDYNVNATLIALGILHNFLCFVILISYYLTNRPRLPRLSDFRGIVPFFPEVGSNNKEEERLRQSVLSATTMYYVLFLVASILGTIFDGYFQSLHLLHIVNFNQLLGRAILAVKQNGKALLWVAILILILLYIYALISFAFFRPLFALNSVRCDSMSQCLLAVIHGGLLSGFYSFLSAPGYDDTFKVGKFFLDVSFYVIISTMMLNIVFGIIVDAFSELRDAKFNVDNDMKSCCFICGHSAYDFEHQAKGFVHHTKKEHYQWAYLFFFLYLDATRMNGYSGLEMYVHQQLQEDKMDFFPLNRALSLTASDDAEDSKMAEVLKNTKYLVHKKLQEEAEKQRKVEKTKQERWEELIRKTESK